MQEEKRKKITATIERLQDLYNLAKRHPFRVSRMGSNDDYYDVIDELGEVFVAMVKKSFEHSDVPYPWYPIGRWIWTHQYWSCILSIRGKLDPQTPEYMETFEHYLNTIHQFIERGKLESFYMHSGYSTYDKKQHEENPMRSMLYVYYPKSKTWDLTKFWTERELEYWKKELAHDLEQVRKAKKDKGKFVEVNVNYYERNTYYDKRRIKELKEIINGEA
jgi:hypothetical protein